MLREQSERRDGYLEMVGAYLQIVLVALARLAAADAESFGRTADPTVARAFAVIAHRFAEPLSTSDVARELGLTPGHLTTVVRRRTGRTVGEWVLEHRMAAARDLLVTTDLSAEQVAGRVGFADPVYFSRRFRQAHGLPPGTWRSAARR
jgi:AraC family transcriptional regulator, transcriptional activator of pobA